MKVVFVSNFFNHHQKPFSDEMYILLGDDYKFIETETFSDNRKNMGWKESILPDYVVGFETFKNAQKQCIELINQADIVIIGSAPRALLADRIKKRKTIFYYSERPLKDKMPIWKYPFRLFTWRHLNPQRKNIYMLCASAYTAEDYARFGLYKNRCYKWGYFPEVRQYSNIRNLISKKSSNSLLWCARFIDWKHPEVPVEIAKRLKADGYSFQLGMIGNGELTDKILERIKNEGLADCVNLLGVMEADAVREYMEKSQIFLFTSDRHEGWGAVLNESMNSGCAVLSSHAIGSTPFLLQDKENGLIYKNGDIDDLYEKVKYLLNHPEERMLLGENAYNSIRTLWNPRVAAERFLEIANKVLEGKPANIFLEGPCSPSRRLKDDWFER